jgi:hypothetical protein
MAGYETAYIEAYQLPLTTQATPILTINSPLPLQGGGTFTWSWSLINGGIAYQPDCDCVWLSDQDKNRTFRIRNVSTNPTVDIVLGQTSISETGCNQGRDSNNGHPTHPSQNSLCAPGGLAIDQEGNLYVADHNLEFSGNWRLLEFDENTLPTAPTSAVYGIPASRVFGRNGSFTEPNCISGDPMCGPWEPAFNSKNQMVVGFNGYLGSKFPQVYRDPLTDSQPVMALNDFYSHAFSMRYDQYDNLYVLDLTRNRVLIYWGINADAPILNAPSNINVLAGLNYSVNEGYFNIKNDGGATLQWTATSQTPSLITMNMSSGQMATLGTIAFTLNVSSLSPGDYVGTIYIDAGTAGTALVTINVKVVDVLYKNQLPFIAR